MKRNKYIFLLLLLLTFAAAQTACSRQPSAQLTDPPPSPTLEPLQIPPEQLTESSSENPEAAEPPLEVPLYDDYAVSLEVDPAARTVNGVERVSFTNRSDTALDEVVFRVYLNAFKENETPKPYFDAYAPKIFALGEDYGYMNILHVSADNMDLNYAHNDTVLRVKLNEPLLKDQTVQVRIQFEAYVPMIAHRTGANARAMWCGNFLPVLSYLEDGKWATEPYYPAGDPFRLESANYTVEITTPSNYTVAGSGAKTEEVDEEKKVTTFSSRMARDFAFAVSANYKIIETVTESGVRLQFYHYTDSLDLLKVMDTIAQGFTYYERSIGAYPYKQVTVVETDMFVNGMENSNIIFMDSAYMQRSQEYASLIHEIGHQWFFDIAGNNQITEAWLDEGITTFVQERCFNQTEEALREKLKADYDSLKSVHSSIVPGENRVIAGSVAGYKNWSDYYQIKYIKAKIMLYALREEIGAENFTLLINGYFSANSYRIATGADFIAKAEEIYGSSLKGFFDEWLYGEGLPEFPD
ncbi:MAG: M1 family metallopeptidase [Clostridiales bacterium]|jgi:hypothetical protein|nr:M1 family metallopeptidase [Clostridiales bacterium]